MHLHCNTTFEADRRNAGMYNLWHTIVAYAGCVRKGQVRNIMINKKYEKLKQYLLSLESVAVAYSGGVDSTLLLKVAHEVLGNRLIAVSARSRLFPERELKWAKEFCTDSGIKHIICDFEEMDVDGFSENPVNRCYLCKRALFSKIFDIAREHDISHVTEGSNNDDNSDYRPGHTAVEELGAKSPLRQAGLTKDEIRAISRELGLSSWDKQSFACLASRFPYGEKITHDRLNMIDRAEQFLIDAGFGQIRVRFHGNLARIETDMHGVKLLEDYDMRKRIYEEFRNIGFSYIASDLLGYRMGSMNETIHI